MGRDACLNLDPQNTEIILIFDKNMIIVEQLNFKKVLINKTYKLHKNVKHQTHVCVTEYTFYNAVWIFFIHIEKI